MLYTSTSKFFLAAVAAPMCLGLQVGGKDQEVKLFRSLSQRETTEGAPALLQDKIPAPSRAASMSSLDEFRRISEMKTATSKQLVDEFMNVVYSEKEMAKQKLFDIMIKRIPDEKQEDVKIVDLLHSEVVGFKGSNEENYDTLFDYFSQAKLLHEMKTAMPERLVEEFLKVVYKTDKQVMTEVFQEIIKQRIQDRKNGTTSKQNADKIVQMLASELQHFNRNENDYNKITPFVQGVIDLYQDWRKPISETFVVDPTTEPIRKRKFPFIRFGRLTW